MKKAEYIEKFDCAPFELRKFAEIACEIEDDDNLKDLACKYLHYRSEFEDALAAAGVEIG